MKHCFFALLIALIFSTSALSQNRVYINGSLGISKEVNMLFPTLYSPAWEFGALYWYPLNKRNSLRFNLGYKRRGYWEQLYYLGTGQYLDISKFHLASTGPDYTFEIIDNKLSLYSFIGQRISYLFLYKYSNNENGEKDEIFSPRRIQFETKAGLGIKFQKGFYTEVNIDVSTLIKKKKVSITDPKPRDLYFGITIGKNIISKKSST